MLKISNIMDFRLIFLIVVEYFSILSELLFKISSND